MSEAIAQLGKGTASKKSNLLDSLKKHSAKDYIFAVVGYAGSGTSHVAEKLEAGCKNSGFNPYIIKARSVLADYAESVGKKVPDSSSEQTDVITFYQNIGDELRMGHDGVEQHAAVAAYMIKKIHEIRKDTADDNRVFILDSLKNPEEVNLLRHVYSDHFYLIGVGCRPDVRNKRLKNKLKIHESSGEKNKVLIDLVNRDAEDSVHKYGQQVNNTFHLSDYFVDNTPSFEDDKSFTLPDRIADFLDILFSGKIFRPKLDERGLYHAHAESLRSSCLSRQVGAAILDKDGNLLSVGTNDVPKFQGGLYSGYGEEDDRCFKKRECCSNDRNKLELIQDLYDKVYEKYKGFTYKEFEKLVLSTGIKSLIEFSRSVHAEMEAILSLVRTGTKIPEGATLYSTTYPCHNCARHIVAAGIERVVYLEPYSKSKAIDLHNDSIADNESPEKSLGKVKFLPYQGISPSIYRKIYLKDAELKDKKGLLIPLAERNNRKIGLWTKTYLDFEVEVIEYIESEIERSDKPIEAN